MISPGGLLRTSMHTPASVSQLRAQSQDAATAQGLPFNPHVNHLAMIELTVSSVRGSGCLDNIRVTDLAWGKLLIELTRYWSCNRAGQPAQSQGFSRLRAVV